ncbi:hypothetical protein Q1695_008514 [Nippostrongylus brasiliensis]|nr:hypothetical protein Q1695_008514 [Nippostrongylus brasiliensis]
MDSAAKFQNTFGHLPTLRVFCPGRVNLIGEHIDYHGYGVLPMAIEEGTEILAAPNQTQELRIKNADEQYPAVSYPLPLDWNGASPPKWYDYVLCGWKGITDKIGGNKQLGFDMLVEGSIPPSSGLSSSSSLVCAAALVTWAIHTGKGFDGLTREELADLCAVAERYVGTQGGGMDQAVEVLAVEGSALKIDFSPLKSRQVTLPSLARFVVLHCGDTLNKAATSQYNERVVEGRLAGKLLLKNAGDAVTAKSWRLKDVQEALAKTLEEMVELCESLPTESSLEQLETALGEDVVAACLSANTSHMTKFKLRSRARHVYSEARRVDLFEKACAKNDLNEMGRLMTESHTSCSKYYECSCDSLDVLVEKCLASGAYGARLTGAGWGGCAIALIDNTHPPDLGDQVLFYSEPSAGISLSFL